MIFLSAAIHGPFTAKMARKNTNIVKVYGIAKNPNMTDPMTFDEWITAYAHRVKLMAGFKTLDYAMEHIPNREILLESWEAGDNPNEAADEEMSEWEE
jgi:hypothetical protein